MTGKFCVYVHRVKGVVIYVGKGQSTRPRSKLGRNSEWHAAVGESGCFSVEIVQTFDNNLDARLHEAKLIQELNPTCNIQMNSTLIPRVKHHRQTRAAGLRLEDKYWPMLQQLLTSKGRAWFEEIIRQEYRKLDK